MTDIDRSFEIYVSLLRSKGEYDRSSTYGCLIQDCDHSLSLMDVAPCDALVQYLTRFVPDTEVGPGYADFLTSERINREHTAYIPSCCAIKCGFFTFASAGDGAAYSICSHDQMVYLLPVGGVQMDSVQNFSSKPYNRDLNYASISGVSEQRWPNIHAFFLWLEDAVVNA